MKSVIRLVLPDRFFHRIRQHKAQAEFTSQFDAALIEDKPRRPPISTQAGPRLVQH